MSEYTVTLMNVDGTVLETYTPFFVKNRAERWAQKETRRVSSPSVIAEMRWTDLRNVTHTKQFRMGRVYRP